MALDPVQNITNFNIKKFTDDIRHLAQQEESYLRKTVRIQNGMIGDEVFFDQLDSAPGMQEVTTRFAETPNVDMTHLRRSVKPRDFRIGHLIDPKDLLRLSKNPQSDYAKALAKSKERKVDEIIIGGFTASVQVGKLGNQTTEPWNPVSYKDAGWVAGTNEQTYIPKDHAGYGDASGDTQMSLGKLIAARSILTRNEAMSMSPTVYVVCSQADLDNLLLTDQIQSVDYNTVRALVSGEINSFMGFQFIRYEGVPDDGTTRKCFAYMQDAVGLCIFKDFSMRIDERADLSYATQMYGYMNMDAVRLENKRMVEIQVAS